MPNRVAVNTLVTDPTSVGGFPCAVLFPAKPEYQGLPFGGHTNDNAHVLVGCDQWLDDTGYSCSNRDVSLASCVPLREWRITRL